MFLSRKSKDNEEEIRHLSLDEVVEGLSLDDKIALLSGKGFWHTAEANSSLVKVPSVMVSDGPHGLRKQNDAADNLGINDSIVAVCFPCAVGLAASFDKSLMFNVGSSLSAECQAENVSTLLGPAINIKRSPLCGRNFEYFSEDPLVAGEMAAAYIDGVQSLNTGTSLKHFAVNNQEYRRYTISAEVDERALREIYLKGFETAVKKAQPWTVMCSYNKINGIQSSENKKLLTDILRDEWGFKGLVMSDWGAVNDRVRGIKAGLDLEMPGSYGLNAKKIKAAVEDGTLKEEEIDKCVRRVVNLAFKWQQNRIECEFDREEHHNRAKAAALKTMVLLKNENNILPLNKNQKIAFIGEYAKKPRFQGGGSSHINCHRVSDAYTEASKRCEITYSKGFGINDLVPDRALASDAVEAAREADIAVIFAGLPECIESEGFDRTDMKMPECQNYLIEKIAEVQKNVVVVLHNGAPVEMPWIDKVSGVLEAYLGGEAVGEAETELLFGEANPCAKLAETFPLELSDTPCFNTFIGTFNTVEHRESIFVGYRYYETAKKEVLFPFGHGLSYTSFEYSDLKLSADKLTPESKKITVSLTVKNTGERDGEEIVQLYISPEEKTVFRSDIELRGFTKVKLKAGESKTAEIEIDAAAFSYFNTKENAFVAENGKYLVMAGASVADIRLDGEITLEGFPVYENPYTDKVNRLYNNAEVINLNREEFELLLGRRLDVKQPQKPYGWDSCLADAVGTKYCDFIDHAVHEICLKAGKGSDMIYNGAMATPVRMIVYISNGVVSESMGNALVDLMNEKSLLPTLAKLAAAGIETGINAIKRKTE